jgi:pimeloyl-ACP methyl ester carboxylesterase
MNTLAQDVGLPGMPGRLYSSGPAGAARAAGSASAAGPRGAVGASGANPEPTYLLLHGIGVSHRYLKRLHQQLAETAPTHSLDLPGFAAKPSPGHRLSVADYAEFIGGVLDRAGIGPVVVVGHSMGAQFAVELALQRPELVSRVVLIGPVVDPERRTAVHQALALGRDMLKEPPLANAVVFTDYLRCGPRWYLKELPVMLEYPMEERTGLVDVPVLIVRGSSDPVGSAGWCRRLLSSTRRGQLTEIKGRHVVQHASAPEVAAAIRSFTVETDAPLVECEL